MRKAVIPVLVSVLFFGCLSSGQIKVRKDDFTKKTVVTVDYYSLVSSEGRRGSFSFAREFDAKSETAFFTVEVYMSSMAKDIGDKCFIKIDEQTFEFSLNDPKNIIVTNVQTTTTTTYAPTTSSSGYVDYTKGQKNSEVSTSKHKELGGKIILSDNIKKALLSGKNITFRLYSGTDPLTFEFSPEYYASLVKFYQTTGEEKQ
jgi:hypothetical protein